MSVNEMIDIKSMILHKCPKRGCHFPIDAKITPTCPHCKFQVSKLLIGPHRFMKYVQISNLIPVGILLTLIATTEGEPLVWLAITAPMHLTILFAGQFLIVKNSLDWMRHSIREQTNWVMRKPH